MGIGGGVFFGRGGRGGGREFRGGNGGGVDRCILQRDEDWRKDGKGGFDIRF